MGYRLAYEALYKTYKKEQIDLFSPMLISAKAEKNRIRVKLSHAEKGLTIKGKTVKDARIAGTDGIFHPADIKLEKSEIIFSSKKVKEPKTIYYGFDNTQMGNIFNTQGLPVAPFRISF